MMCPKTLNFIDTKKPGEVRQNFEVGKTKAKGFSFVLREHPNLLRGL